MAICDVRAYRRVIETGEDAAKKMHHQVLCIAANSLRTTKSNIRVLKTLNRYIFNRCEYFK